MIVPMKLLSVVSLRADREKIIAGLQELGVLHINLTQKPEGQMLAFKSRCLQEVNEAQIALDSAAAYGTAASDVSEISVPEELLAETLNEVDHLAALKVRRDNLLRDIKNLTPWGNFSFELLRKMENEGVYLYLCQGTVKQMEELAESEVVTLCQRQKKQVWFVVSSLEQIQLDTLPLATVPEVVSLLEAEKLLESTQRKIARVEQQLCALSRFKGLLAPLRQRYSEDVEFEANLAGMDSAGDLVWIQGYIPADERDHLAAFAKENGCAVQFADPGPEDQPPTCLRNNFLVRMIKPLFDFCGIIPGYREWDVSAVVLLFFTIFVAMIVNDAGYGLVFLAASLAAAIIFRKKAALRPLLGFFILESVVITAWGILTAGFFGLPAETLEKIGLKWMVDFAGITAQKLFWVQGIDNIQAIKDLSTAATPEKLLAVKESIRKLNIEYFCFILAFAQLGFARLWKAWLNIRNPRKLIAHLGWISILLGNFFVAVGFIVFPGSIPDWVIWTYVFGVPMMLVGVDWFDIGEIFHAPLELINGFVDTLSYIRLYAVGLAGACVASNFNGILGGMATSTTMTIVVIVFLLAGHGLNIALCMMGVMVHAIRLNALEFSGHMGLEWAGTEYKPFKKQSDQSL